MHNPTVFISYFGDSEPHKEWVLKLADLLIKSGVNTIPDQYDLSIGKDMTHFMETGITADKMLAIMTPNYKIKADRRAGGVGYEYSMLTQEYYVNEPDKTRIFPILREGDVKESSPLFMQTKVYHDMRDEYKFDSNFFELVRIIFKTYAGKTCPRKNA